MLGRKEEEEEGEGEVGKEEEGEGEEEGKEEEEEEGLSELREALQVRGGNRLSELMRVELNRLQRGPSVNPTTSRVHVHEVEVGWHWDKCWYIWPFSDGPT